MICVSAGKRELLQDVFASEPDLIEIRYDLMGCGPNDLPELNETPIKQVATCRPGPFDDDKRLSILIAAIENGASYVDLDIESDRSFAGRIKDACIANNTELIYSYHNFDGTPTREDLLEILRNCFEEGAAVAKIACMSSAPGDNARLLSLYDEPGRKVVLGMGEAGKITRFTALPLGAEFTFAAVSSRETTAPGQPTIREIRNYLSLIS